MVKLSRDQIAKFVGRDPDAIRQIEKLFGLATENNDAITGDLQLGVGQANSAINSIAARVEALVQGAGREPTPLAENNKPKLDYIDLNRGAPRDPVQGRVSWNDTDKTIDVGVDWGVVLQVGEEAYLRAQNTTGVTIPNGTVVGFAGASGIGEIRVAPFLADGSSNSLAVLGIMTHDLPDSGQVGYCTLFGKVRDINTSAWAVGDALFCSPTVPGGLTNVKPTAPNNVVAIGLVLVSHATQGVINVRPTIEQQEYYGTFAKTTNQSPAAINTAYALTFDSATIANGFAIGAPTSRIVASHAALYNLNVAVQITSTSAVQKAVWIWLRKNGVDVANTARLVTSDINNGYVALVLTRTLSLAINDYVEVMFASDSTNVSISAVPATAFAPASSAATFNIFHVAQ